MTPVQAVVLGTIQGLSEFLPISSSAHLYAVPTMLGWRYEGLAFDVALHGGTLLALLIAFGSDWIGLFRDAVAGAGPAGREARSVLARLVVASIPGAVAGVLLEGPAEVLLRSLPIQAAMLAAFGLLLWWVDRTRPQLHEARVPGWGSCVFIGCAQALALIPGVSRSGITMTAARGVGLSRVSSATFSFLLATPITFGAVVLEMRHLPKDVPGSTIAIGVVSAAVVGLLAIRGLIRWLGRAGFGVFAVYRVALALVIVVQWIRA